MKKIYALIILCSITALGSFPFKQVFLEGKPGNYSIYQNGNYITILNIHSIEKPFITFEEITLQKKIYKKKCSRNLTEWMKKGAPGSTSWKLVEINIDSEEVTSAYCNLKKIHLSINKEDSFMPSLLNLNVDSIPDSELKRLGPKIFKKKDPRPYWLPQMIVEGIKLIPQEFMVYGGTWNNDLSFLSGKNIDLYILNKFPFPYWIEIHGDIGSRKMVSIDSGYEFLSQIKTIPSMPPKFISKLELWNKKDGFYSFLLESNRKNIDYQVYMINISDRNSSPIPVESTHQIIEGNILKFNIMKSTLKENMSVGRKYRLSISYTSNNKLNSIISRDIIHWK